jgi:hypothetical protein
MLRRLRLERTHDARYAEDPRPGWPFPFPDPDPPPMPEERLLADVEALKAYG